MRQIETMTPESISNENVVLRFSQSTCQGKYQEAMNLVQGHEVQLIVEDGAFRRILIECLTQAGIPYSALRLASAMRCQANEKNDLVLLSSYDIARRRRRFGSLQGLCSRLTNENDDEITGLYASLDLLARRRSSDFFAFENWIVSEGTRSPCAYLFLQSISLTASIEEACDKGLQLYRAGFENPRFLALLIELLCIARQMSAAEEVASSAYRAWPHHGLVNLAMGKLASINANNALGYQVSKEAHLCFGGSLTAFSALRYIWLSGQRAAAIALLPSTVRDLLRLMSRLARIEDALRKMTE